MKRALLLLWFFFGVANAQQLVNCGINTPCDMATGPQNTHTGDPAWLAFGKINANFTPATAAFFSAKNWSVVTCFGETGTAACNPFGWAGALSGSTSSGVYAAVRFSVTSDTFANTSTNALTSAVGILHNYGGVGARGGFSGLSVNDNQAAQTADLGGQFTVATFTGRGVFNQGGTAFHPLGSKFGANPNIGIQCNSPPPGNGACATNWNQIVGIETDIQAYVNTSVRDKIGQQIVQQDNDAVSASGGVDIGYTLNNGQAATGWQIGYGLGGFAGYFPLASTASIFGCFAHANIFPCGTTANGINLQNITFTGYPFESLNYAVDSSGGTTATSYAVGSAGLSGTSATLSSITVNSTSIAGNSILGGIYLNRSSFPSIVIGAPPAGGTQAVAAVATMRLNEANILTPGTGASNNDVLTLTGGAGTQATVTLAIPSGFNGSILGNNLTVSSSTGLAIGQLISDASGNVIQGFSGTGSISGTTLTMTAITYGKVQVGSQIAGANVSAYSTITALGTGVGGTGTYTLDRSSTAGSTTISATGTYITGGGSNNSNWKVNVQQTVAPEAMVATGVAITTAGSYSGVAASPGTTGGSASVQPVFQFGFGIATVTVSNAGAGYLCNPTPQVYTNYVYVTDDYSASLSPVMSCSTVAIPVNPGIVVGGTIFGVAVSASTCAGATSKTGGATAGTFILTTGGTGCVYTYTLPTAPHGWICQGSDITAKADAVQSATGVTSCALTQAAAASNSDVIGFSAIGY